MRAVSKSKSRGPRRQVLVAGVRIHRPLEGEPAFADVALILRGIVRDSHINSVYTIWWKSSLAARMVGVGEFEQFDGRAVFDYECDADAVGWAVGRNQDFAASK